MESFLYYTKVLQGAFYSWKETKEENEDEEKES